ncbi:required for drug-induced death protein 1 [Sorex araneus]|uniref:required for drug-induced death protein 1 n=1 Tax=Sorex araneus TaxID=42254 RepID=UPI00243402E4|nr:required for drug-induced death protein 1 [Sorex araneus]
MTVGARLRSKAAGRLRGRGPAEDEAAILELAECGDEAAGTADAAGRGARGARGLPLAARPERYEPLDEPAPAGKPRKRYRQKLKKYGKNFGKVISKGCRYVVLGLQGFAAAYSAPFGVATSVVSFVR